MNSCFEKFVGFKRIMSDKLDRKVALKNRVLFSNYIRITQKNVLCSYYIKLLECWGNFQSSKETKKVFYGKDNEANA